MSPGTPRASAAAGATATAVLTPVVTDVVDRAGFVLDDLEVRPAGRRQVVRVTVDTDEVPGPDEGPAPGLDLDAVAGVSRELSAVLDGLDEDGSIPAGEYTLEVSTPGTDRPLTTARHWQRAWLRKVAVTLADGGAAAGRVGAVDDAGGAVTLAETTKTGKVVLRELAMDTVAHAVIEVEFKPAPPAEVDALRRAHPAHTPGPDPEEDTS